MKNGIRLFEPSAKSKTVIIPQSIDVDKILTVRPPTNKHVNRDNIIYIVNLLYKKSFYHDEYFDHKEDGFIPLQIKSLRNFSYNIEYSLRYLISLQIVLTDNKYIKGVVSKGYKINERYFNGKTRLIGYSSYKVYQKIQKILPEQISTTKLLSNYPFLAKPFIARSIGIDANKAFSILRNLRDEKIDLAKSSKSPNQKIKKIHNNYIRQSEKIIRIIKNDYSETYGIDSTSFRFHSLITNMKKELRPLLTLNGEPTVSFDLKNSQPFFMLLLFRREAYLKYEKTPILRLPTIDFKYTEHIQQIMNQCGTPFMMQKSSETLDSIEPDLNEFLQEVKKGTLYECLLEKKYGRGILYDAKFQQRRKAIKKKFISYLYDIDREVTSVRSIRALIKDHFPTVYSILCGLKAYETGVPAKVQDGYDFRNGRRHKKLRAVDSGFKKLAILLQTIESRVILDICCRRIDELFPEMSFLTVHDSIIVPRSYQESVYGLITDLVAQKVGCRPKIEIEA